MRIGFRSSTTTTAAIAAEKGEGRSRKKKMQELEKAFEARAEEERSKAAKESARMGREVSRLRGELEHTKRMLSSSNAPAHMQKERDFKELKDEIVMLRKELEASHKAMESLKEEKSEAKTAAARHLKELENLKSFSKKKMAEIQSENDALRKAAHAAKSHSMIRSSSLRMRRSMRKRCDKNLPRQESTIAIQNRKCASKRTEASRQDSDWRRKKRSARMLSKALSKAQAESDRLSSELSESRSECQDLEKVITEVRSKALSSSDAMEVAAKKREKIEARLRRAMESLKAAEAASAEKDKIIMAAKKKAKQAVSDGRRLQNAKRKKSQAFMQSCR